MATAILTDARFAGHTNPRHVERAERLGAIEHALAASGLRPRLQSRHPRPASSAELLAVHQQTLLNMVERMAQFGGGHIDGDTYVTEASWEAATLAAGAAVGAVEAVLSGQCANAFALVRPPGHHATPGQAMGFCLVNNIAVAAQSARQQFGLERVAIVDFDVHHGNGTQDAFYDNGQVLFCSTHAAPLYPGTGAFHEMGSGPGSGTTFNIPLPYYLGDAGYMQVYEQTVIPALRRFRPQLLLVSAGYDAHGDDPLGPMSLSTSGYARLTQLLHDAAAELCDGRLVLVLEGGYDLDALGASVVASLRVLLGDGPGPTPHPATYHEPDVGQLVERVKAQHPLLK